MKSIFLNSVIAQAIELGFDFEQFSSDSTVEEMENVMFEFFRENSNELPQQEDECEVTGRGNRQHVSYGDFESSGEIVDFSSHWHKDSSEKIFHSDFVMLDGHKMVTMNLYFLVGETEYNAPDGFWFNPKTKSHEIENS